MLIHSSLTTTHFIAGIRTVRIVVTPEMGSNAQTRVIALDLVLMTLTVVFIPEVGAIEMPVANFFLWNARAIATGEVSITALTAH